MSLRAHLIASTVLAGVASLLLSGPVSAQSAPASAPGGAAPGASAGDSAEIGEVVVTAEKRVSTAQRTPIAMSVYDSSTIAKNDITDLQSLSQVAPTVQFGQNGAATLITIRGVSSRDNTEIGDADVTISIDGFYLQRSTSFNASLFDLERIEVLRGPQGTLYGRNATAGAINVVTASPKTDFEGMASVEAGDYNRLATSGMINIPLSDKVQVRAAFQTTYHEGYRDNSPVESRGDDQDDKAGRISIKMEPTDRFTALVTLEDVQESGVGPVTYGTPLVYNADGSINHNAQYLPANPGAWPLNYSGYTDLDVKSLRWNLAYDFGAETLTYLGGYRQSIYHRNNDYDGSDTGFLAFEQNENEISQNHEIRLSSNGTHKFNWQVGGFYFYDDNALLSYFQDAPANPVANLYTFNYPSVVAESYAAFGQASYMITDALKLEGGVRYSHDYKSRSGFENILGTVSSEDENASFSKVTYHGALDWQVTSRNLLYAKVDTGYKAGGFTSLAPYGPESLTAYEVGSKNHFLDNRLQINLDGYYYDYTDLQVSQFIQALNGTLTSNAGAAQVYGVELEGEALFTPHDRFDWSWAYLHAVFTKFNTVSEEGSGNLNLAGNHLIQAPTWTLAEGLEHTFDIWKGHLTARVQTKFESASYLTFYNYGSDRQAPYTKSDVILTYSPEGAKWTVEGYVRNLENSLVLSFAQESPGINMLYQFQDPRTFGGRVTYRF